MARSYLSHYDPIHRRQMRGQDFATNYAMGRDEPMYVDGKKVSAPALQKNIIKTIIDRDSALQSGLYKKWLREINKDDLVQPLDDFIDEHWEDEPKPAAEQPWEDARMEEMIPFVAPDLAGARAEQKKKLILIKKKKPDDKMRIIDPLSKESNRIKNEAKAASAAKEASALDRPNPVAAARKKGLLPKDE